MKKKSTISLILIFAFLVQMVTVSYVNASELSDGTEVITDSNFVESNAEENSQLHNKVPGKIDEARIEDAVYNVNKLVLQYGSLQSIPTDLINEDDIALAANTWGLFHTTDGRYIYVYDYCTVPGASSYYVRLLQTCLSILAYDVGVIDGIYGPDTEYAIVCFQRDQGLSTDGIAGERTWRRLSNYFAEYGILIDF